MASTVNSNNQRVDPQDPRVRRLVYGKYRDLLVNYHDRANDIIAQLPEDVVREDKGVAEQIQSMIRQSSLITGGEVPGMAPPARTIGSDGPAPPPPPPLPCGAPTKFSRPNVEAGVPPPAIQTAMMTKDKKPFTYTPGGIDLSEIKSPRMQKRISRNAQSEGVGGGDVHVTPHNISGPLPPQAAAVLTPALAIPVLPSPAHKGTIRGPTPPTAAAYIPPLTPIQPNSSVAPPLPAPTPQRMPIPPTPPPQRITPALATPVSPRAPAVSSTPPPKVPISPTPQPPRVPVSTVPPPQRVPMSPTTAPPRAPSVTPVLSSPSTPVSPPMFRNEPGCIYVPPVVGGRPTSHAQVGSIYVPPLEPNTPPSPQQPVQKTPLPWMNSHPSPSAVPPWIQAPNPPRNNVTAPQTRIIPIHVEGRDPVNTQQQRSPPVPTPSNAPFQKENPTQAEARIIPIQMEGADRIQQIRAPSTPQAQPPHWRPVPGPRSPDIYQQMPANFEGLKLRDGSDPMQSRSFHVIQKITDDESQEIPFQGVTGGPAHFLPNRAFPLTSEERQMMGMLKSQVDEGGFLHSETDPRYRGPAIPSRAFRTLQNMTNTTNGAAGPVDSQMPRRSPVAPLRDQTDIPVDYVHPSQQQPAPEPKKYTGGNIPSRSFRMLQAMTHPDDLGPGMSDM